MREPARVWWRAEQERVHEILLDYVHSVEQRQSDHYERFEMLETMYDPNGPVAARSGDQWRNDLKRITENVIAINVDTVRSAVATTEIRPEFQTDGADWSTQRRARELGMYAEELSKQVGVAAACRLGFFGGAKKGTGINKVYADRNGHPRVDSIMVDNVIVDDTETQNGAPPKQLHYRQVDYDRDELINDFPEYEEKINAAQSGGSWRRRWSRWGQPSGGARNDVLVIESWRLPYGQEGDERYIPGRHVICIEGCDLLDEEWHKPQFPLSVFRWNEREGSWFGISLAERILGHQRTLNKRNWQRDRQLDQVAVPITYLRPADINASVKTTQAGNFVAIKGDYPQTVVPTAVGPEMREDRHDAKASAFEETGVSRMAASSVKPAGLESGAALREWRDQGSQRFSLQEMAYEKFWLDTIVLLLDVCKDLGKDAPVMSRRSRFATRRLKWRDVDLGDVRVQIAAAATLNRTPAGRKQTVLEFTQAGIFSMDEARRLLEHPDIEQATSLYTAALEAIEQDLEMIEDGDYVLPEPFINLDMAIWRGQNRYLVDRQAGAPEEILEGIRTYVVQAANLQKMAQAPAPAMPMGPGGPMPPGGDPMAAGLPPAPGAVMPAPIPMQVPSSGAPLAPMNQLPAP